MIFGKENDFDLQADFYLRDHKTNSSESFFILNNKNIIKI